jgi:hypothetical protein
MQRRLVLVLALSATTAFAQGRPAGAGGGRPSGAGMPSTGPATPANVGQPAHTGGRPADSGKPTDAGKPADAGRPEQAQQPLKDSQINGGAFRMLEQKTGMTSDQLKALYASSGAKNFGEFVSAVVVSKNLELDTNQVLEGLKTKSLGETLKDLGVPSDQAKQAIKQAKREAKASS